MAIGEKLWEGKDKSQTTIIKGIERGLYYGDMGCSVDRHCKAESIERQILAGPLEIEDTEYVSISNSLREYENQFQKK